MDLVALSSTSNISHIVKSRTDYRCWTFCGRYFLREDVVPLEENVLVTKRVCLYCQRSKEHAQRLEKKTEQG